jgi:DNA-directed RNA polymerase subunit M/transcription elongation factor TFIIS
MGHKCKNCKYYYIGKATKSKEIYNAISDELQVISVDIKQDSCGVNASAVLLEENQPRCKEFDNE